jgi:hypothetical protein
LGEFLFLIFACDTWMYNGEKHGYIWKMECLQEWTLCFRKSPPLGEEKLPDLTFPQTTLQKSAWLFMIMKFLWV